MKNKFHRNDFSGIISLKSINLLLFLSLFVFVGCQSSSDPLPYQTPENSTAASGRPIVFLSASDLAAGIRSGTFSSHEVISAHINHIHKYNPDLNALVVIDEKTTLDRARQADEALAAGELWGPLHGVPVSIKDHFAVKNMRITNAFTPLSDQVTDFDATIVKRLKNAGAIILGITNMPVMAMDVQTFNPIYGRTNNPWDLTRTPGGSTGGGAAAVATGMSPLTIGSDLAGSIRIPAAFCGVYGIKPTENFVSSYGIFPGLTDKNRRTIRAMASLGPLARSIKDLKLCLSIIAGPDGYDAMVPAVNMTPKTKPGYKELRIAWSDNFGDVPVSNETRKVLKQFIDKLSDEGCTIKKINPADFNFIEVWETWGKMVDLQINVTLPSSARFIMYTLGGIHRSKSPLLQMVYPATYDKFIETCSKREILIAHLEQFLMEWDVFICPVTTQPAYKHLEPNDVIFGYNIYDDPIPVDEHQLNYWMANAAYTAPFNTTGHPAVTIPAGYSQDGMPIGVQLVGRRWHDMELLEIAEMIDAVAGAYREPAGY
ncbi:MAG: amidase [Desulfobacteraceae bacterium]|nr:amidase [Desulfobacteraceae bacterium]MBC2755984.1 amidase [Desulfobacteraceae bacterium]